MNKQISDFLNECRSFEDLIAQYAQGFNDCHNHYNGKSKDEQALLNNFFERYKSQKNQSMRQMHETVNSHKAVLDGILSSVKSNETAINDKRYFKFIEGFTLNQDSDSAPAHYTKQQIDEQARKTKESINKLVQLKSIPKAFSYVNKNFRESLFTEIITNIKTLEKMIVSFKNDHDAVYEREKNKINSEIADQKTVTDQRKNEKQSEIHDKKQEYLRNLVHSYLETEATDKAAVTAEIPHMRQTAPT